LNQSLSPESFLNDQSQAICLGSKRRSLLRQSSLLFWLFVASALVFLFYVKALGDPWPAAAMVVMTTVLIVLRVIVRSHYILPEWAEFISRDSAYGMMKSDGIEYRAPFRLHRVPWVKVYRVVYRLQDRSRVDLYLFNRHSPIRFGPALLGYLEEPQFMKLIQARLKAAGVPLDMKQESKAAQPFPGWLVGRRFSAAEETESFRQSSSRRDQP